MAAVAQHATRFGMAAHLVGEEHRAELADDEIEAPSSNGSCLRIRLLEADIGRAPIRSAATSSIG